MGAVVEEEADNGKDGKDVSNEGGKKPSSETALTLGGDHDFDSVDDYSHYRNYLLPLCLTLHRIE